VRELRLGEIRRCRLITSRRVSKTIRDGLSIRAVVAPQGQDPISNGVAYANAVSLSSAGKLRQRKLQLSVERCLEAWITALSTQGAVVCSSCRWRSGSGRGTPLLACYAAPFKPSEAGRRRSASAKLTMPDFRFGAAVGAIAFSATHTDGQSIQVPSAGIVIRAAVRIEPHAARCCVPRSSSRSSMRGADRFLRRSRRPHYQKRGCCSVMIALR
jgi:hypothetical protein